MDDALGGAGRGAGLDRREDALDGQPVGERRGGLGALRDVGDQVDDLVREPVLVPEAVSGRPPRGDVRVRRLGDEDAAEAGHGRVLGGVEELQDVHVLEVERERAERAVDLEAERVLAPRGEPGGLEDPDGTVVEADGEGGAMYFSSTTSSLTHPPAEDVVQRPRELARHVVHMASR